MQTEQLLCLPCHNLEEQLLSLWQLECVQDNKVCLSQQGTMAVHSHALGLRCTFKQSQTCISFQGLIFVVLQGGAPKEEGGPGGAGA